MDEKRLSDMTPEELASLTTAELVARMGAAARQVRENAATSIAAAESIARADQLASGPAPVAPAAEVVQTGDGRDVVTVAPQASPAREVELAARAALGAGLDPFGAALRQREVIVDRLLADLATRSGAPVAVACRDCGARFGGRPFLDARCPRCGELEVIEAGRVA